MDDQAFTEECCYLSSHVIQLPGFISVPSVNP